MCLSKAVTSSVGVINNLPRPVLRFFNLSLSTWLYACSRLTPAGLCLHCLDLRLSSLCETEVSPLHVFPFFPKKKVIFFFLTPVIHHPEEIWHITWYVIKYSDFSSC